MELTIANISHIVLGLNIFLFLVGLRKFKVEKTYIIFTLYLGSISVISIIAKYMSNYKMNNLFLSHYYFIVQFVFLSLFYRELLSKKQKNIVEIITIIILVVLSILFILVKTDNYHIEAFDPFEVFICSFPIIVYSIMHLYNVLNDKLKYVYINSGILIYFVISTLVFILANLINNGYDFDKSVVDVLWSFNESFYLIYLILIFIEWYKKFKQSRVK